MAGRRRRGQGAVAGAAAPASRGSRVRRPSRPACSGGGSCKDARKSPRHRTRQRPRRALRQEGRALEPGASAMAMTGCLPDRILWALSEGDGTLEDREHLGSCGLCQWRARRLAHDLKVLEAVLRGLPPAAEALAHGSRSEEHTSELQSLTKPVCRLLIEKK